MPIRVQRIPTVTIKMISDADLYKLAIFLGSGAMLLIVLYHFLEINNEKQPVTGEKSKDS